MAFRPAALAVRFLLELTALAGFGYWGWHATSGALRWGALLAVPLLAAVLWTVFATPGDPSRSGDTVVRTPGALRFLLELLVLFGSAIAVYSAGAQTAGTVFFTVLVVYHLVAYDRVVWLFRH